MSMPQCSRLLLRLTFTFGFGHVAVLLKHVAVVVPVALAHRHTERNVIPMGTDQPGVARAPILAHLNTSRYSSAYRKASARRLTLFNRSKLRIPMMC